MSIEDFLVEQHADGWHVRMHGDHSRVFRTREQAEAFTRGALADGASQAQALTSQGDVVVIERQAEAAAERAAPPRHHAPGTAAD